MYGEKAHSCYFSKNTFEKLTGANKELWIILEAVYTNLYNLKGKISFNKVEELFEKYL